MVEALPPRANDATVLPGWIVTYVQDVRSGGPSAGYISSGFFGGMYCSYGLIMCETLKNAI